MSTKKAPTGKDFFFNKSLKNAMIKKDAKKNGAKASIFNKFAENKGEKK